MQLVGRDRRLYKNIVLEVTKQYFRTGTISFERFQVLAESSKVLMSGDIVENGAY